MERIDYTTIQNVILDAVPIIHLDEINSLHLLLDFKRLILSDAVWREVEYHRPSVFKNRDINFEKVNAVFDEDILSVCKLFCLDTGELEVIALCSQCPDSILLTDDASARLVAKTLGIRAHGTIGVLLRAIRRRQITPHEAIGKLEEIPQKSTLFISLMTCCRNLKGVILNLKLQRIVLVITKIYLITVPHSPMRAVVN